MNARPGGHPTEERVRAVLAGSGDDLFADDVVLHFPGGSRLAGD